MTRRTRFHVWESLFMRYRSAEWMAGFRRGWDKGYEAAQTEKDTK